MQESLFTQLDLLVVRTPEHPVNLEAFTQKSGVVLPPVYRSFVESFMERDKNIFKKCLCNICSINLDASIRHINVIDPGEYIIDYLFDLEVVVEAISNRREDEYIGPMQLEGTYLAIGSLNGGAAILLLGIHENNRDQIFVEYMNQQHWVANNIYEYLRSFVVQQRPSDHLTKEIKSIPFSYSEVYCCWGENFWRHTGF